MECSFVVFVGFVKLLLHFVLHYYEKFLLSYGPNFPDLVVCAIGHA